MKINVWVIMDVVIMAYGIYTLIAYFQMKSSGQINQRLLARNRLLGRPCRDKEACYKAVLQPTMIMGIVALLAGGISLLTEILKAGAYANLAMTLVFLAVALWYSKRVTDAIRKYYY